MVDPEKVCYEHGTNPAAVGCQRCGRPICTGCMVQASVGFQCPGCLKRQGQHVIDGRQLANQTRPVLTIWLIAASVAMFVVQFGVGGRNFRGGFIEELLMFGPDIQDGAFWQIFTSGFLHANPVHIGFNMFLLWMIGSGIEDKIGKLRYALIYFSSLFSGGAFALAFNFEIGGLGASGAVLGMFGGMAGLLVLRGHSIREVPGIEIIALNLILPLIIPGISFWAHFGGIVGGFITGALFVFLQDRVRVSSATMYTAVTSVMMAWFLAAVVIARVGGLL